MHHAGKIAQLQVQVNNGTITYSYVNIFMAVSTVAVKLDPLVIVVHRGRRSVGFARGSGECVTPPGQGPRWAWRSRSKIHAVYNQPVGEGRSRRLVVRSGHGLFKLVIG